MARRGSAIVVALGLLAACSSNGDASPAAETTSVPPTAPSSTDAPTTTTGSASTSTIAAPPTTIDPADSLAAEVEADFLEADRLGREASMDPFDRDKEVAALDRRLGVIRDNFAARLADYRTNNYAIRANDAIPASITVEVPALLVVDNGDVAEMQICEVDSWILVEVGAGPNGSDAIVDSEVVASRSVVFLRNSEEVWLYEGGAVVDEWEGATTCSPVS